MRRRSLAAWLVLGGLLLPTRAGAQPGAPAVPVALTPTEYNHTIADLLGFPRDGAAWPERPPLADELSPRRAASRGVFVPPPPPPVWPWRFPDEPGADGFEGIARAQSPSAYQVEQLHLAAMHFAAFVPDSPIFFVCDDWNARPRAEQLACGWSSVARFAERAYRRPLTEDERARLAAFWAETTRDDRPLDRSIALTIAGVLQAPAFHFRLATDAGATDRDAWALASRLSYFLWDSMPDDALLAAAARGELTDPSDVEREARRLLADPRARPAIVRFHHQWLGTDAVLLVAPARRAFGPVFGLTPEIAQASDDDLEWPAVLGPIRHSMRIETELFVEATVFDGPGTFTALLTDHRGFMSDATARLYGPGARRRPGPTVTREIALMVASIGREQTLELYPAEFPTTERAGVLTLPSVLALGAYAVQPGPILRGTRVLDRLACVELGTPIQGAESALPPDTLSVERTNRQRTEAATRPATCAACHRTINPPGFAFEHYDALGRWRADDNGQPVDASGTLALGDDEVLTFTDGIDFVHQLARSPRVRDCYVAQWTGYALGRTVHVDAPELDPLQARFREDDRIGELLIAIASSPLFLEAATSHPGSH